MNTPTLGIIGGGQLGSLLADAAKKIDVQTVILSDDPDAPGKHFATKFIFGQYDDDTTINNFINAVDLVTYEFENIPTGALDIIERQCEIFPSREALKISQDRLLEKEFINKLGFKTASFYEVSTQEDLIHAIDQVGTPSILKTRRFGYDGKGQLKLEPGDLQIFKGRFTLHRVTKVEGNKSRYMCIPAYVLDPWRVNTPEHSKAIYGKVLPIHLERNVARSDGLTD